MGSENLPGGVAEQGWRRASQSKLYHKVELDALSQNMLKLRPQGTCSPESMGSKNLPGGVAEQGCKRASQSRLYHKVELDALCQNMLKIRPRGTCSRKYGITKPSRRGSRPGLEASGRAKVNCTIR